MQFVSISIISRAADVFAAWLVRHRPAACEFSKGRFDVWPCTLVIMIIIWKQKRRKYKQNYSFTLPP